MTAAQFTPAQLAQVDQTMVRLDEVLDELLADARADRDVHGRPHALVSIAYRLLRTRPPGNLASIAAAAVLRLHDQAEGSVTAEKIVTPWARFEPRLGGSIPAPNACMACGIDRYGHASRWHWIAERHTWIEPSDELRLARMRARREARQIARMRARQARP